MPSTRTKAFKRTQGTRGVVFQFTTRFLDEINVSEIVEAFHRPADVQLSNHLYLDFRAVDYFSGAVMGQLLFLQHQLQATGEVLVLLNLRPFLKHLLQLCRLGAVLPDGAGTGLPEQEVLPSCRS